MRHENLRQDRNERYRREILDWVVRQLPDETRIDRVRGRSAEQPRVAVGRRMGGELCAYDSPAACAVVDDDLLAEVLRKFLGNDASDDVGAAAGRQRNDPAYRTIGIRRGALSRCVEGGAGEDAHERREVRCP